MRVEPSARVCVVVALVSLLLTPLGAHSTAWASVPDAGVPGRLKVLALGDSYTAGVGDGDYYDGSCMRSPHSWADQWVSMVRARGVDVAFENQAWSGATTRHVYVAQDRSSLGWRALLGRFS